jgi:hypothetical protein
MVILSYKLSPEVPHHSVKDIKKPTLFAEDVAEWASINKTALAPPAVTQLPDLEDVYFIINRRWMVIESPTKKGSRNRKTKIHKNHSKNLQEQP